MNRSSKQILIILVASVLLLAACAPAPAPATQDPAEIQRQVQEAVALTVAAHSAQTEQAQAQIPEPTNTPLPTQTEAGFQPSPTPVPPTVTAIVIASPTTAPSTGGSGVPVSRDYVCNIINQSPRDNSYWKRNKDFDVNWTIVNTGTKSWEAGLDLVFYSGTNMAKTNLVELPALAPGGQHKVVLDAVTPSKDGFYVMTWKLEGGFCFPYIAINVEQ